MHPNHQIYARVVKILEKYFTEEEEGGMGVDSTSES
jgi:hypothetical protein